MHTPHILGLLALLPASALSQVQYTDEGPARGILPFVFATGMASGVAAADYDGDGDIDLFVPNGPRVPDQLYRNLGDGTFEEIAQQAGVASLDPMRSALWFDYDGDRDLDLVVTGTDCYSICGGGIEALHFYEQLDPDHFIEVTSATGIHFTPGTLQSPHITSISAGDADNDGDLDLLLGMWAARSSLWRNQGDGTFLLDSEFYPGSEFDHIWQSVWHDFNGDGWQDILTSVDYNENHLFLNDGDGTFTDRAPELGIDNAMNDMGVALGDYDNDGDLDFYITNITQFADPDDRSVLFRNLSEQGSLAFEEVGRQAGVDDAGWGWGCTFLDCDNDGWLDLAATNGFAYLPHRRDTSLFFVNPGREPFQFREAAHFVGFDDQDWGSSLVAADFDRDGDLDLTQVTNLGGPLRLLMCQHVGPEPLGHYLCVRTRMDGPNTHAIGAVVRVQIGTERMMRLVTAGTSLLGQEPAEAFFGLGQATVVDRLHVTWPDGTETLWTDVAADQVRTLVPGGTLGDLDMDTDVDEADLALLVASWGPCADCDADLNGDGVVDWLDLEILRENWG